MQDLFYRREDRCKMKHFNNNSQTPHQPLCNDPGGIYSQLNSNIQRSTRHAASLDLCSSKYVHTLCIYNMCILYAHKDKNYFFLPKLENNKSMYIHMYIHTYFYLSKYFENKKISYYFLK